MCFENGQGVTKDLVKAVEYYTLAANQGNAITQYKIGIRISIKLMIFILISCLLLNIGFCYKNGKGVTQDLVKAVEYYTLAANQGNDVAQYNLGIRISIKIIILSLISCL